MKIGDVVYLKSGSPELTIVSIDGETSGVAICAWKVKGLARYGRFAVAALTAERPTETSLRDALKGNMLDAGKAVISLALIREEIRLLTEHGLKPVATAAHPDQIVQWENQATVVTDIVIAKGDGELPAPRQSKITMQDLPCHSSLLIKEDELHFVDGDGRILGMIFNLAVPEAAHV